MNFTTDKMSTYRKNCLDMTLTWIKRRKNKLIKRLRKLSKNPNNKNRNRNKS